MEEKIKKELQRIRGSHATGQVHNYQMSITQVEEIFAIDKLTEEVFALKNNLADYNHTSKKENESMKYLTIALWSVALFQLLIAFGQYKLGEAQIEASREQVQLQRAIWINEGMRNDRLEMRDVQWRREDLEFQGRLPVTEN